MAKYLIVDYKKCTGCRLCEITCAWKNEGVPNPELSRIKTYSYFPGIDITMFCVKCSDAPCVASCAFSALNKNEDGCIEVDKEKCTGCGNCLEACRAQVISLHPQKLYPLICNHCGGNGPECIKSCPTHALEYMPLPFDGKYLAKKKEQICSEIKKSLE